MITLREVEVIHEVLIEKFGGAHGIRDYAILESAINRPYQTFDGQDLYPNPIEKAAAIFESIVSNHPFVDGNKRTGYVLMQLILKQHNFEVVASQDEKYDFVLNTAQGKIAFNEIKDWIFNNAKQQVR